jgi:hypothetical protein
MRASGMLPRWYGSGRNFVLMDKGMTASRTPHAENREPSPTNYKPYQWLALPLSSFPQNPIFWLLGRLLMLLLLFSSLSLIAVSEV